VRSTEAGFAIAAHLLDLAALGLGAAAMSQTRPGSAGALVRLKAVLSGARKALHRAGFLGAKLPPRPAVGALCHELLYDGASFTMRLMELRLRRR